MGLDNGLIAKGVSINDTPSFVHIYFDPTGQTELDLCYWRKYWGLRGEINTALHMHSDEYEKEVDPEDIPAIKRAIIRYLNSEYFNENADTIWTYDEAIQHMIQQYINLCWFEDYWRDHSQVKLIWYDSY